MSYRQERGRKIARAGHIVRDGEVFAVPSDSKPDQYYFVNTTSPKRPLCTCADFVKTRTICAHIWAVREILESTEATETLPPMRPISQSVKRNWAKYNEAEVKAPELTFDLLVALSRGLPELPRQTGRQRISPALMFVLTGARVYAEETNRSSIAMAKRLVGHEEWEATHFHYNAFSNYLMRSDTTDHLQWAIYQTAAVFKDIEDTFIVDSTGIGTTSRARYRESRYGPTEYRSKFAEWRKLHAIMGRRHKVFVGAVVSSDRGEGSGDSPNLRVLLQQTVAQGFTVRNVLADKAYIGKENIAAITALNADPVIPFKTSARPSHPLMKQLYLRFTTAFDEFQDKYRERPLVECGFSMLKRKFSEAVRARDYTAQTNESLFLVLCHNLDVLVHAAIEFGIDLGPLLAIPVA